ncbi:MAG: hypothetical protein NW217_11780 [Hyphomicrobiaceae bacterium]|nr:hypothetical protein [Hyphomicrobiaceae bacterium]
MTLRIALPTLIQPLLGAGLGLMIALGGITPVTAQVTPPREPTAIQDASPTPGQVPGLAESTVDLDDETLAQRMVAFIGEFYLSGQNLAPEELEALYAPEVLYFGRRPKSRQTVIADKLGYYRRWPERQFSLVPDTVSITRFGENDQQIDVMFDYDFEVRSQRRVSRGRGTAVLTLDLGVPGGQIVREDGKVLRRGG